MIELFATCPASNDIARSRYANVAVDVARWSERAGCTGMLIPSGDAVVDPWTVAHLVVRHTETICPLVGVHAPHMHPYAVAKQTTSFGFLYGRRVLLDIIAGGTDRDAESLLVEYATTVMRLVEGRGAVKLAPPLARPLRPRVFVSGPAGGAIGAAAALRATAIVRPVSGDGVDDRAPRTARLALHAGIIARHRADYAWTIARSRFPEDRRLRSIEETGALWLAPFLDGRCRCPYLVGRYDTIALELRRYLSIGYDTFILDVPSDPAELEHVQIAFTQAQLAIAV